MGGSNPFDGDVVSKSQLCKMERELILHRSLYFMGVPLKSPERDEILLLSWTWKILGMLLDMDMQISLWEIPEVFNLPSKILRLLVTKSRPWRVRGDTYYADQRTTDMKNCIPYLRGKEGWNACLTHTTSILCIFFSLWLSRKNKNKTT